MNKSVYNFSILIIISMFIFSCVKKTTYDKVPEISYFELFPYVGDSADIIIKFKDGDGDIGVQVDDTTRNMWVNYYYKDTLTNIYRAFYDNFKNDSLKTGYIIKSPTDAYKGKPISGEIVVHLQQFRHSRKIKNIKYVIYLFDKQGNKSNVVTTPEIQVQ